MKVFLSINEVKKNYFYKKFQILILLFREMLYIATRILKLEEFSL